MSYIADSTAIYIMVVKIWNRIWPPPRSPSFLGGQRWQPIQMEHNLHIGGKVGGGLDTILMGSIGVHGFEEKNFPSYLFLYSILEFVCMC
jgi:hypothetical protein